METDGLNIIIHRLSTKCYALNYTNQTSCLLNKLCVCAKCVLMILTHTELEDTLGANSREELNIFITNGVIFVMQICVCKENLCYLH